jgi:ribonuclease-3
VARAKPQRALEQRLGHSFQRAELLRRALTHASVRTSRKAAPDNERLEFLGDRVLGLAAAEMVLEAHPNASEGELARRFNSLVRGETCARVAEGLGIGECMILGDPVAGQGRGKETILADAMEAVLGAVFLDAGFEPARAIVRRHWHPLLGDTPEPAVDAKSALQEWAQGRGLELPRYRELAREGPDHAPRFTAEVTIVGRGTAVGSGSNKRHAEQAAAAAMLKLEGVANGPDVTPATRTRNGEARE